jgi:hypothetical protein
MNFAPIGSYKRLHRRTFVVAICSLKSFGGSKGRGDNICLNRRNFQRRLHKISFVPIMWPSERLSEARRSRTGAMKPVDRKFRKGSKPHMRLRSASFRKSYGSKEKRGRTHQSRSRPFSEKSPEPHIQFGGAYFSKTFRGGAKKVRSRHMLYML